MCYTLLRKTELLCFGRCICNLRWHNVSSGKYIVFNMYYIKLDSIIVNKWLTRMNCRKNLWRYVKRHTRFTSPSQINTLYCIVLYCDFVPNVVFFCCSFLDCDISLVTVCLYMEYLISVLYCADAIFHRFW